ncbi:serine/threonine protein kinase [Chengkuizengella axinellae]|uniref:Serine/threonine protein kinase n=1 Tax=Chengkuizengella axinellae TaxID=3064388 RepID=A0ABT9J323_9BACL|nr:serine/threonine protein kinase [Chengkuizengella sp. 2205SS18-9]MDP5275415.1 serine/threonine protein kinase [Chengkuizengella sp. 2205SS18-9]
MEQNHYRVKLDDVEFQLQEAHNFDWLQKLGRVFSVFDQQDSGNICFGVESSSGEKLFIKYAGARTLYYSGQTHDAIHRLKDAVHLYDKLSYPSLIKMIDHFEVESGFGYAVVFEWFAGETLHPHWSFPPPAKYNDPASPYYRYKQLSVKQRLQSLDRIFSFHLYVENMGYVAVDFYDGSLLYDFKNNEIKVCDIDVYQKKPFINDMGRLWGSSRFMSPEEFIKGAQIDERTNVYNMGAMAFALVGGELDRSFTKWEAGKELYEVSLTAIKSERELRYSSITEFKAAWDSAIQY